MFDLPPPRHISTLPKCEKLRLSRTSPVSSQLRTCERTSHFVVQCHFRTNAPQHRLYSITSSARTSSNRCPAPCKRPTPDGYYNPQLLSQEIRLLRQAHRRRDRQVAGCSQRDELRQQAENLLGCFSPFLRNAIVLPIEMQIHKTAN